MRLGSKSKRDFCGNLVSKADGFFEPSKEGGFLGAAAAAGVVSLVVFGGVFGNGVVALLENVGAVIAAVVDQQDVFAADVTVGNAVNLFAIEDERQLVTLRPIHKRTAIGLDDRITQGIVQIGKEMPPCHAWLVHMHDVINLVMHMHAVLGIVLFITPAALHFFIKRKILKLIPLPAHVQRKVGVVMRDVTFIHHKPHGHQPQRAQYKTGCSRQKDAFIYFHASSIAV